MNLFSFGQSADIDIKFNGADTRTYADVKTEDGKKEKFLLYYDGETVAGKVYVTLKKPGSKLEHQGIKIELIGQIELYYDRGNHHEFHSKLLELARPGDLIENTSYKFDFPQVEKPYEVYIGSNVRLRYFLRVVIIRRITDIVREVDIAVHTLCSYPEINSPIKMEVGIEDCLHIEFEYNKSKYHLKDVIVGKIYFLLVRIKIKHMEIAIIKRETTGTGNTAYTENETIAKYEIMDGAPVKGESIPIRVFLAGYDLTPTMREIYKKFSVRYFLNLVLMDTEDRRYFKQQEITLWRKADRNRKTTANLSNNTLAPSHLVGSADGVSATQDDLMEQKQQPIHQKYSNENAGNIDGGTTVRDPTMDVFTPEQYNVDSMQRGSGDGAASVQQPVTGLRNYNIECSTPNLVESNNLQESEEAKLAISTSTIAETPSQPLPSASLAPPSSSSTSTTTTTPTVPITAAAVTTSVPAGSTVKTSNLESTSLSDAECEDRIKSSEISGPSVKD